MPKQLDSIYQQFFIETEMLLQRFLTPLPSNQRSAITCADTHTSGQEMCVIRLYDSWSRFCRELVILSACYEPIRNSGLVVPLAANMNLNDRRHAIASLEAIFKRPEKNIGWGMARYCIEAATKLNLNNRLEISTAIGSTPSPADDIRVIRNFLAHRNIHTAHEVRQIAVRLNLPIRLKAIQIVHHNAYPNMKFFESWIFDLRVIASAAIV